MPVKGGLNKYFNRSILKQYAAIKNMISNNPKAYGVL